MRFLHRLVISIAVSLVGHLGLNHSPDWVFPVLSSKFNVFGQLCNFTFEPLNLRAHNNLKSPSLMLAERNLSLKELGSLGFVGLEKFVCHRFAILAGKRRFLSLICFKCLAHSPRRSASSWQQSRRQSRPRTSR